MKSEGRSEARGEGARKREGDKDTRYQDGVLTFILETYGRMGEASMRAYQQVVRSARVNMPWDAFYFQLLPSDAVIVFEMAV